MLRLLTLGGLELLDGAGDAHPLLARPKRLGLLVLLAAGGSGRMRRRDLLLSYFWPELDDARARGALRQAVYSLRHELGDGVIVSRSDDELGIDPARLTMDVTAFEDAVSAGDTRRAASLYRGEFLDGFFATGTGARFDEWVAAERARLRHVACRTFWSLASQLVPDEPEAAADWVRRAVALEPDDELGVRRALRFLGTLGDRSGALHLYRDFAERLRREYDARPAPETRAIRNAMRRPKRTVLRG